MRHTHPHHADLPSPLLRATAPRPWRQNLNGQVLCGWMTGQPEGDPWLVLHGGPGSTASAGLLAPFSAAAHWAWAPQQRGSGALAQGQSARWSVDALVADLEALRQQLGLAQWSVLGGSWGALVALAYVRQHPEAVHRVVLRGAFTGASADVWGLLRPLRSTPPTRSVIDPAARVNTERLAFPQGRLALPHWLAKVQRLLRNATPTPATCDTTHAWLLAETRLAAQGARAALRHASHRAGALSHATHATHAPPATQGLGQPAAPALAALRRTWGALARQQRQRAAAQGMRQRPSTAERRKVALQARVLSRRCCRALAGAWPSWRAWLAQGGSLHLLHGRHDAVCTPANAHHLLALNKGGGRVRLTWVDSGHLAFEPAMHAALRGAVSGVGSGAVGKVGSAVVNGVTTATAAP